jgi:F-type H+/Na+-transporting ATPase subunit alpha
MAAQEMLDEMLGKIRSFERHIEVTDAGHVVEYGDSMAVVAISGAATNTLVNFDGGSVGLIWSLERQQSGPPLARVLLLEDKGVRSHESVYSKNEVISVPGGYELAGRIVNGIGVPIDGGPSLERAIKYPVDAGAAPYDERQNIDKPVETGYLAIDALVAIGRGQRELFLGNKHTGKSMLAVDTIINQRGKDMFCVYVATQKTQSAMEKIALLQKSGAMEYTTVVLAPPDATPAMLMAAPSTGCAIGESIMRAGGDALVVYDDFTTVAWAYREAMTLLKRPLGSEAYPGDVFSYFARLLERSARLADTLQVVRKNTRGPVSAVCHTGYLNKHLAQAELAARPDRDECEIIVAKRGGSLTAIPIFQIEQGNFSGLIATYLISITDGQVYLDESLFHDGQRPSVHPGLSVSRVGGAAQHSGVRERTGSLRASLAQLKALSASSMLGRDALDVHTQQRLDHGDHLTQLTIQQEGKLWTVGEQIALLYGGTHETKNFDSVPLKDMQNFIREYISYLHYTHRAFMEKLNTGKKLTAEDKEELDKALQDCLSLKGYGVIHSTTTEDAPADNRRSDSNGLIARLTEAQSYPEFGGKGKKKK